MFFKKLNIFVNEILESRIVDQHIVVVDQTVSLLRSLVHSSFTRLRSNIDAANKEMLTFGDLSSAFSDVFCAIQHLANV